MRADVATLLARVDRAKPVGDSQPTPGKPVTAAAHDEAHN
jgi:NADH-quinone oxidoreductase subunit M